MKFIFITVTLSLFNAAIMNPVMATEAVKHKVQEAGHDAKRSANKAGRAVKDKTCEMVNGKMECAAQKVKHSMQNGADKAEDAVD